MQVSSRKIRTKAQITILQSAATLATKNKSYDLSIRQVATISGYSYGTLYKYYRNSELLKKDLFKFELESLRMKLQDTLRIKLGYEPASLELIKSSVQLCLLSQEGHVILDLLRIETKKYQLLELAQELEKLFDFLNQHYPDIDRDRWFPFFTEFGCELMLKHCALPA